MYIILFFFYSQINYTELKTGIEDGTGFDLTDDESTLFMRDADMDGNNLVSFRGMS